eukprot:611449_1
MSTLVSLYTAIVLFCRIHSINLTFEYTPNELHPEIVKRIRQQSNCKEDQLELIHQRCEPKVNVLIRMVYQYEYGSRKYGISKCERAQIACFTHKLWKESAHCACTICDHVWFYDEQMHERFVSYFENHRCKGIIPNQMDQQLFCNFMNQTERSMEPDACRNDSDSNEGYNHKQPKEMDYDSNDAPLYTNHVIIIWTVLLAITMSLSLYFWIH